MPRKRLDTLLVEKGLAETREKARRFILAGLVSVEGRIADKAGMLVHPSASLVLAEGADRYVSRGGWKCEGAVADLGLDVHGKVAVDVGSSTGGFTDCLLQHGARKVYAVDVGKGLLHWKLRKDPRVVVMESLNARGIKPEYFDERPELAAIDVSFISLGKILPPLLPCLAPSGEIVALVKPQFEAGRREVRRGGVIRDARVHRRVLEEMMDLAHGLSLRVLGVSRSHLKGPAGNVEFFIRMSTRESASEPPNLPELIEKALSPLSHPA